MTIKDLIKYGYITEETDLAQYTTRDTLIELLARDFSITPKNTKNFEEIICEVAACCGDYMVQDEELHANIDNTLAENGWLKPFKGIK